jgi:(E)-4-hydroxy-3-methylbut-2-enyl-diphosphate synthase
MIVRMAVPARLHRTVPVRVGHVQVGGGAPVVVQSMTMTETADAAATARQCVELAEAGSEMVRVTVNTPEAAEAVPEIKKRMLDAGCHAPLIGDFHYNGHLLLARFPDAARTLDKYRINPGNVGTGKRRDEQFMTICKIALEHQKPVRIGVNGGSLNQELVMAKMQENTDRNLGHTSEDILNECMVLSALQSTDLALEAGLTRNQIIISCKVSRPRDLIAVYRDLAKKTDVTRCMRRARSCRRWDFGLSRRRSPPAPAAAGRRRRHSRSWPSASSPTCAR